MCGFAGEVATHRAPDVGAVAAMSDILSPRGPDGAGSWSQGGVALGHRRLSIIDLSPAGAQPMHDAALGLTIAFNGCIYNYPELRQQLIEEGWTFTSSSDTEVVLVVYDPVRVGYDELLAMFWEMHEALFDSVEAWSVSDPTEVFQGLADEVGLDADRFAACQADPEIAARVDSDLAAGAQFVQGTPTFIIVRGDQGSIIPGALPEASFSEVLDEELAAAGVTE